MELIGCGSGGGPKEPSPGGLTELSVGACGWGSGPAGGAASRPACGHGAYDSNRGHCAPTTFLLVDRPHRTPLADARGSVCNSAPELEIHL